MTAFDGIDLSELQRTIRELGLDGWLLFDFHGLNPVAGRVLALRGLGTRRIFVLVPATGEPVAVAHKIEMHPVAGFPGRIIPYARWEELHAALGSLVRGRTLAMEVSPEDAVPYLDRVPNGVVELLTRLGAKVVPSGGLVTQFAARWSAAEREDHMYAAGVLASVARKALAGAVGAGSAGADGPLTETMLQSRVTQAMAAEGLVFDHPPIVGFGANAANPHYEPKAGQDATLRDGDVILLDLWGGRSLHTVFADQTWMGFAGERVPEKVETVWRTVRDARDAAIALFKEAAGRRPLPGFALDRAARGVIEAAGFGDRFVHRTGHSIDRALHGSGPHLDDYETHDDRELAPGVGFSIEPGIYLSGEFGVRSEVNGYWSDAGPVITPADPQVDLIVRGAG